jgi:molecular chaperone DnaK (HSP70)
MVESTAAALGYGLLCAGSKNILVVDIGGGTTDVTITSIKDHTLTPSALAEPDSPDMPGGVEVTVMATAGHSQVSSSLLSRPPSQLFM